MLDVDFRWVLLFGGCWLVGVDFRWVLLFGGCCCLVRVVVSLGGVEFRDSSTEVSLTPGPRCAKK